MSQKLSTGEHLITTSPNLITCKQCGTAVMAATIGGIDRHVDFDTLNELGELAALLEGRRTFEVSGSLLIRRDVTHIKAGRSNLPVVAEHAHKRTPAEHVDQSHQEAAVKLLKRLMGATVIADNITTPPF